jgi:hypothetical protein
MNFNKKKNYIFCYGMIRIRVSEASVSLYRTTRPQISKDSIFYNLCHEILTYVIEQCGSFVIKRSESLT